MLRHNCQGENLYPPGFSYDILHTGMGSRDVPLLRHDSTCLLVRLACATDCPYHQSVPLTGISCCPGTRNTLHAMPGDMASNLHDNADSLRKICRPSHLPVASTSRSCPSVSKRAPVFRIDHGLCLMRGKVMPTNKGSCIELGQRGEPTGIRIVKSANL